MNALRIIFMGTPEFAVESLEILLAGHFSVVAVVTAPDKPQGRGQKIVYSPVKECAMKHNLPVLQPTNLKSIAFIEELRAYHANLQIVVAFRMLPEAIWAMPNIGTFNLHASLLPQYRGAAPIHWAIINGEKETGVTTFFLRHEIDTGGIIFQEREAISDDDTVGALYQRLMKRGGRLVLKTVEAIRDETYAVVEQQDPGTLKHAPKIFRETCEINWGQSSDSIRNFVRGLNPFPVAWCALQGKTYKIFLISKVDLADEARPGTIRTDNVDYLFVKSRDGWVSIDELQPEGKRKMNIREFFRGNKF